tara:strand:+ start:393 stop:671 length:279 start_codon:yes stop_codon:yes gene_type:complete
MKETEFDKFINEMQRRGTIVASMDGCMCADCVARRKKHGAKPMQIIPEETDDPIQNANRQIKIERLKRGMSKRTTQAQRKTKQRKNKKKKEE